MNGSSFLRKRGEVGHGRRQATRTTPRLLAALIALFVLGLVASGGTSATSATEPSLELMKTADAATIDAGDPIGFRIDLTNHGVIPNQGRIIIENRIEPNWAPGAFSFSGDLSFSLGSYGGPGRILTHTAAAKLPGTYRVTEDPEVPSFQLTGLVCNDANSSVDLPARTATIRLEAGETVRCTFTNSDPNAEPNGRGLVIIEKQAPAGQDPGVTPGGSFSTTLPENGFSCPTFQGGFMLHADEIAQVACELVVPGTYTVTEEAALGAGAEFVSLSCDDANSTVDLPTRTATIRVEANETVRCAYVNRTPAAGEIARNVTLRDQLPTGPGLSWSIDPAVPGCSITDSVLSCSTAALANRETLSVHVTSPTTTASCGRYDNTAFAQADNRPAVQASASVTVTCPAIGTIVVKKQTRPAGSQQSFAFTASYNSTGFSLSDGQSNTSGSLAAGNYSVSETAASGWDSSATCDDGSPINNIGLSANETVTCTFVNTQRGLAKVVKTVGRGAPSGTQSFAFELRQGASSTSGGTILESANATAANGGVINFTTKLVPGTTYALCEIVMPGWMTTLGPPFYVVYNPSGDNSTVCTDFTVSPGATKTFAIDNKPPPGGLARTIGFWKNWASCAGSKGNQKPVLDQTLTAADPAGIVIGTLTLHAGDCLKAVRLLDKSTVDAGKKMASDPAFALAAQLLAATLNIVAGAGSCPAAVTAINDAQTLLASIHFNGITHDKLSAAQATQATALATTLDRYNNNLLC
jgi:hypothetical protein